MGLGIVALALAFGVPDVATGAGASYSAITAEGGSTLGARACYPRQAQDNPLLHYSFNEDSGATAEDGSGNGKDGVIRGSAARVLVGCSSDRAGAYLRFDGAAQGGGGDTSMVSTPDAYSNPSTFTLEAWFRTSSSLGGPLIGFGDTQSALDSNNYDRILWLTDGQVYFATNHGGPLNPISSPARYDDGSWHLAQASLSSNGLELSVDGALVASDPTVTTGQNFTGWWRVGRIKMAGWSPINRWEWNGDIDDVAIYSTRLAPTQVAAHYAAGR